jgi:hypothetical protein
MTTLQHIRILPPLAIARFGSAETPVEDYDFGAVNEVTQIRTLIFTASGHQVTHSDFKDGNKGVKPVSPFLELWGIFDNEPDKLQPLTPERLASAGLDIEEVEWEIEVANRKLFRRTDHPDDIIEPKDENGEGQSLAVNHTDTTKQPINARANNFKQRDKTIFLGQIEALSAKSGKPLRVRFTPGKGLLYQHEEVVVDQRADGNDRQSLRVQVPMKEDWVKPVEDERYPIPNFTTDGGCFDDSCDCLLTARVGKLQAYARVSSAPPDFSPDTQLFRTAYDEFEQILLGPEVTDDHYPPGAEGNARLLEELINLYQRIHDTVSLINPKENARRWYKVRNDDPDSILAMAHGVHMGHLVKLNAYKSSKQERAKLDALGKIFSEILERDLLRDTTNTNGVKYQSPPRQGNVELPAFGDLKMPFLMRGSDGGFLVLTDRQRDKFGYAAKRFTNSQEDRQKSFMPSDEPDRYESGLPLNDILKLLRYRPAGNPPSTSMESVVGNCFPGLDLDLRGIWQRLLRSDEGEEGNPEGDYILHETDNALIANPGKHNSKESLFSKVKLNQTDGHTVVELSYKQYGTAAANKRTDRFNRLCKFLWQDAKRSGDGRLDTQATYRLETSDSSTAKPVRLNELLDPETGHITRGHAGELTHGLCSPWQKDFRDCNCVYWSANAPDYVAKQNETYGEWMEYKKSGGDTLLDDLYDNWQEHLKFVIQKREGE